MKDGAAPPVEASAPRPRFIPLRTRGCIAIVPIAAICRIEARDNHVEVVAERAYRHRATLSGMHARLRGDGFVRVHRSHLVNLQAVRELRPRTHGEYVLMLADGTTLVSGRRYRESVESAFGLASGHRAS